jgi:hypothetical protein
VGPVCERARAGSNARALGAGARRGLRPHAGTHRARGAHARADLERSDPERPWARAAREPGDHRDTHRGRRRSWPSPSTPSIRRSPTSGAASTPRRWRCALAPGSPRRCARRSRPAITWTQA